MIAAQGRNPICAFLVPQADAAMRLLSNAGIAAFRTPEACADGVRAYLDWRQPRPLPSIANAPEAAALAARAGDEPGARALFAALGLEDTARCVDPAFRRTICAIRWR